MTNTNLTVKDGIVVNLDFTLRLDDGQVVGTTEGHDPLKVLQGDGQLMPALERELRGMAVGDEKDVVLTPAEAYGEQNPDAFELVPRDTFPADMTLTQGQSVRMRDQSGEIFKVYVADIRPDGVLLDFNHPLAGETLYFNLKVVGLRPATPEELAESPDSQ